MRNTLCSTEHREKIRLYLFVVFAEYCYRCLSLQVLRCSNIAVVKVTEITELIKKALENDSNARLVLVEYLLFIAL